MSISFNFKQVTEIRKNTTTISQVYYGSDLVWENCHYKPGQVVYSDNTAGTRTFSVLSNGYYQVTLVGAGGGGSGNCYPYPIGPLYASYSLGGGGSGGGIQVVCYLRKNIDYLYTLGSGGTALSRSGGTAGQGGTSSFDDMTSYGGIGGWNSGATSAGGGTGGVLSSVSQPQTVVDLKWNKTGNNGSSRIAASPASGGGSIYNNYGAGGSAYGSGFDGYGNAGSDGGIEVVYLDKAYVPIVHTLVFNINVPSTIKIDNVIKASNVTTYSYQTSYNSVFTYEIAAEGYTTQTNSYRYLSSNAQSTLNITMEKKDVEVIFNILGVDPSVLDPTITVNGTELTSNTYNCKWGDSITYTISNEGYQTITKTVSVQGDSSDDTKMFITETMERDTVQLTVYDKYFNRYVGYEVIDAFDENNIIEPFKNVLIEANSEGKIEVPTYTILRYGINRGNRGQVYDLGAQERYTVGTQDNDTWAIFREYVTGRKVDFFIQDVNAQEPWTNQSDLIGKEYNISFNKGFVDNFTLEPITGIYNGNPIELGEVPNSVNITCNISDDQLNCNVIDYVRDSNTDTYVDNYTYLARVETKTIYFTLHNETDAREYDYQMRIDNPYWTQADKERNSAIRSDLGSLNLSGALPWGCILYYDVISDDYKNQTITVNSRNIQQNEIINIILESATKYSFTIIPTPSDATVLIDNKQQTTAEFKEGKEISYTVQAPSPYKSISGTYIMRNEDYVLNIELQKIVDLTLRTFNFNGNILTGYYDLTITSTEGVENKHVEIEAQDTTIEIPYGADINITAFTEECGKYEETITNLTTNQTKVISPDKYKWFITVTSNVPATIQINSNVANAVTTHSAWVDNSYNYSVFWRVGAEGYTTQTGTITERGDIIKNITLVSE